jgi:hypothetical protein
MPLVCRAIDTPLRYYAAAAMGDERTRRPRAFFARELDRAFHVLIEWYILPASALVTLAVCTWHALDGGSSLHTLMYVAALALLPLGGAVVPTLVHTMNMWSLARVHGTHTAHNQVNTAIVSTQGNRRRRPSAESLRQFTTGTHVHTLPQCTSFSTTLSCFVDILKGNFMFNIDTYSRAQATQNACHSRPTLCTHWQM